ncbi:MAG: minor capsid protein [Deltaproteobacteria bacterium]|nr:minor capsid protein [Deltaproteobacteria bacterium]
MEELVLAMLPKLNFLTTKSDAETIIVRTDDIDITARIGALFHSMKMKFFGEAGHGHEPKLINYTRKITNKIVKPMLGRANDHNKKQFSKGMQTVLAVDPLKAEPFLRDQVALATKANVDLIKTIPKDYFHDIEGLVTHAARSGESIDTLAEKIHARTGNEQSRCRLIARDQISKFNGALHQERAQNNGITRYIWHTVRDQRVRSDHDHLDTNTYLWSDAPITVTSGKRAGEKNHPGMDIQCRCYAENIWEDLLEGGQGAVKLREESKPEEREVKMTSYKMVVKENGERKIMEMQSESKKQLISDLRANGYQVNPAKVKKTEVFEYIMNHTNAEEWDWREINKVPE